MGCLDARHPMPKGKRRLPFHSGMRMPRPKRCVFCGRNAPRDGFFPQERLYFTISRCQECYPPLRARTYVRNKQCIRKKGEQKAMCFKKSTSSILPFGAKCYLCISISRQQRLRNCERLFALIKQRLTGNPAESSKPLRIADRKYFLGLEPRANSPDAPTQRSFPHLTFFFSYSAFAGMQAVVSREKPCNYSRGTNRNPRVRFSLLH